MVMKKILVVLILASLTLGLNAQSFKPHFFDKNTSSIYMGIGLFPTFQKDKSDIVVPPSSLGYENRVSDNISLGGRFGYSSSLVRDGQEGGYFSNLYFASVRVAAHCSLYEKWDIYGGGALATYVSVLKAKDDNVGIPKQIELARQQNGTTSMTWMAFVGAKYALCNGLYLYGEVSYGVSIATIGMGVKL